jgi:hypothetical protein
MEMLQPNVSTSHHPCMSDPIASLSVEEFTTALASRIFSDQEIAHWIRSNPVGGSQKVQLLRAIDKLKGGGLITGILRTALREMEGLPPVSGDDA